jgi:hypothetical protein
MERLKSVSNEGTTLFSPTSTFFITESGLWEFENTFEGGVCELWRAGFLNLRKVSGRALEEMTKSFILPYIMTDKIKEFEMGRHVACMMKSMVGKLEGKRSSHYWSIILKWTSKK